MSFVQIDGFGSITGATTAGLAGITDLTIYETARGPVLLSVTRGGGYLVSYELGEVAGDTRIGESWALGSSLTQLESTDLAIYEVGGQATVFMAGLNSNGLIGMSLNELTPAAVLGGTVSYSLSGLGARDLGDLAFASSGGFGIAADRAGGLYNVTVSGSSLSARAIEAGGLSDARVGDLDVRSIGGQDYAIATHWAENAVSLYSVSGGSFQHASSFVADGASGWFSQPMAARMVEVGGAAYAVVAAAGSSSLSVLSVQSGQPMELTDHVIDTLQTRFAHVSVFDTAEVNGITFVVAAGTDNGLSVFAVLPGGRLQHVETIEGDLYTPLDAITNLAIRVNGDHAGIYATREAAPYLVELEMRLPNAGAMRQGGAGNDVLLGTAGNDILAGGAGNDSLSGGNGDDILMDGAGQDTMRGGAGADEFVAVADGVRDVIVDFQVGQDRLDLTGLGIQWDPSRVTATVKGGMLELYYGEEVFEIWGAGGTLVRLADLEVASFSGVEHMTYTADALATGPALWLGSVGPDQLIGQVTADRIDGQAGNDTIISGPGDDTLSGGDGSDLIRGGTGADVIEGGENSDTILGEDGDDALRGDNGADMLNGGAGNDTLNGGNHSDYLNGGDGNDLLQGSHGIDRLDGGSGNDSLYGGDDPDMLWGGTGADALFGEAGGDRLFGGAGNDRLFGNSGRDVLSGDAGDDTLDGGWDPDIYLFRAGHGHDRIVGFEAASGEEKIDLSMLGGFNHFDDVMAAATQVADGVLIETGADSSILIEDVDLDDLDASNFNV